MKPEDRKAFLDVVIGLCELKGKQLSAPALEIYWGALQRWPIDEVKVAANHLATTCEFMPMPKDFEDLRKAGRATAGESWAKAVKACGTCHSAQGYTSGGTCGDPFIDRVVRAIGGYKVIAMCDEDKLHFLELRFTEHFETMLDADDTRVGVPEIAFSSREMLSGPRRASEFLQLMGKQR